MSLKAKNSGDKTEQKPLTRELLEQASKEQLIEIVLALYEENEALKQRIAEIERRLGMNSDNSSKPPSSDPPDKKARRGKKKKSKKKRGAQPGHKPQNRSLVPVEEVDQLEKIVPQTCEKCGCSNLKLDYENPFHHQYVDIPPVTVRVIETQLIPGNCTGCGHTSRPDPPESTPRGAFSPRVQAIVAYLTGACRLGKRTVRQLLEDLFGLEMSLGSVTACEKVVSRAVGQPVEQAQRHVQQGLILHADETSCWQNNVKHLLWVTATSLVTVFMINRHRGKEAARQLLGAFEGVLVTDRWKPYRVHNGLRQFCWAHLE